MRQTEQVVEAMKACLKMRGMSYGELAKSLGISESSVKRLFSEGSFTLKRVLEFCEILQIELRDLTNMMQTPEDRLPDRLSPEQELSLTLDEKLFSVFYLALNQWQYKGIARRLKMDENEVVRSLVHLDRLKVIDLQPRNRIVLKVQRKLKFNAGGPFEKYFRDKLLPDFLASDFSEIGEQHRFISGEIASESWAAILKKIERLEQEIGGILAADALLAKSKTTSVGLLFAARPWVYAPVFGGK